MSIVKRVDPRADRRADAARRRDGGGRHRVADGLVQELAARLHRARGAAVSERHAVDRAARRQSVLRRRDGEHRRVDGRQPGGGGEGSRARLQRLRAAHQRVVGRQHPPRQTGDLPAARRRHLVAEPAGEETGDRGRSHAVPTSRSRSTRSASPTDRSSSSRRSGRRASRCPKRFDHLDAKLSFKYEPVRYSIEITHVSFRGSEPALALNALSGGISVKDDTLFVEKLALRTSETSLSFDGAVQHYLTTPVFNLQISSDKLSVPEIARLVPALAGIRLQPSFNVKADGPLDRLGVEMNVQSSAGLASGKLVADLVAPGQSVQGDLSVRHLDLSTLLNDPTQKSDITADARVDLHGEALSNINALHGTVTLDSPRVVAAGYVAERVHANARIDGRQVGLDGRAAAYGASATVAGDVTLPDFDEKERTVAFDRPRPGARTSICVSCRAQLKVPPAATDVNAEYHAVGSVGSGSAGPQASAMPALAGPSWISAFSRRPSPARASPAAAPPASRSTARTSRIAPTRPSPISICSASASEFHVPALADRPLQERDQRPRRRERPRHDAGDDGRDRERHADRHVDPRRHDSAARLRRRASRSDTAHVKADGQLRRLRSGGRERQARGEGHRRRDARRRRDRRARVQRRDAGQRAGRRQGDAAAVDDRRPRDHARLARRRVSRFRSATSARSTSPAATSTCRRAARSRSNDTGQSNLKVHADSPSLEEIGKLVDQPISGIGKIDATVTGNKRELKATGNLVGDGVKYGDNGALTVSSNFTATVPELTVADANVVADTHATFVSIAGQDINELDAKTTYHAEAARLRRDRQAAAAIARRRRLAGAASGSSGSPPAAARPADAGADVAARAGIAGDDQLRPRRDRREEPDARERRSADRRRRHVRPAGRRAEGDAHQRRPRQRRRDPAAAAAADRDAQRVRHGRPAPRPRPT